MAYFKIKRVLQGVCPSFLAILFAGCSALVSHPVSLAVSNPDRDVLSVCYDYGCKNTGQFKLSDSELSQLEKLFESPALNPLQERDRLAKAVALMEQFTGKRFGTWNDKAENRGTGEQGQMDCIDESTNTTRYLWFFNSSGWLKWHTVEERVRRNPYLFDIHWTAVIKDKQSHQLYAVDSWFRKNGEEPIVMPLDDWKAKKERF